METESPHGVIIFQGGRVVYANQRAAQMAGRSLEDMRALTQEDLFSLARLEDRGRLVSLWQAASAGEPAQPALSVCLERAGGACHSVDALVNQVIYQGQAAMQMYWIDSSPRREAEVMRDVMVALASAGDLKQTLEALLVNLRNVIHYDRAGLILVDEEENYVLAGEGLPADRTPRTYLEYDPLVVELRRTQRPIVVQDAQVDARLAKWPDLGSVRGWMGAPLMAGEEMIGFLSLGSLQADAYSQADVALMHSFASQVADVLARAWRYERSYRRAEELEVLSSISSALGKAERGDNTLLTIVEQIARFFGADRGAFLAPERGGTSLAVWASLDARLVGRIFSQEDDLFWQALVRGDTQVIPDVGILLRDTHRQVYKALFPQAGSAVVIPLKADEAVFGLLYFAFSKRRELGQESLRLFDAVSEIAAASLQRAVVLEALERQIKLRTQHLSTLYAINSLAGEPLDLTTVLQQVLDITLQAMKSQLGAIHLLNEAKLALAVQRNVPARALARIEMLSLEADFWRGLAHSASPLVAMAFSAEQGAPAELIRAGGQDYPAYIGAPIRAKGRWLGLLSIFAKTLLEHSAEDITLFMTIADQIGGVVERARLMEQAELAAVVEERQRLARELHDSVTQLLYSQVLFSGAGLKVLRQGNQELAEEHLARIDQAALQALKEMRLLVYQLRPSDTLDEGLVSALERRLESVERRTGIDARLALEGVLDLDEGVEMALYRIAEEALNNTLKHAGARRVQIAIHSADGRLRLEVADDGCGFDLEEELGGGGMGLCNMRERAAALGGELQIISQPGKGTHIILELEVSG
ncbi:MAG: GAF domain-containing protein [Anaerolineales bacterium]|nr:GAF domain-containing protein [Anaerolineales bacterium]